MSESFSPSSRNAEVTAISTDPFREQRYYIGTQGEGVWIFDGAMQKYVAASQWGGGALAAAAAEFRQ